MATLKPLTRYQRTDGKATIFIRIIQNQKIGYIKTDLHIEPKYMRHDGTVSPNCPNHTKVQRNLNKILYEYNNILLDLNTKNMTVQEIVSRLRNKENGKDFVKYTELRIEALKKEGRFSYADSYKVMTLHLKNFIQAEALDFKSITPQFLEDFDNYLKPNKVNTRRIYLNNIRAIFNHALDHDVIQLPSPFRKFKVKQESSEKRAIPLFALRKLRIGPYFTAQQRAVDLFFLSFYLQGMNLKDMLFLRPEAVSGIRLYYRRAKTGQLFNVKILPEALQIIEKYKGKDYLLNILDEDDSYSHYKNVLKETNKRLRIAAGFQLSTYSARHSWASIASELEIPKETISAALGHQIGSEMTDVYIKFNQVKIDEANQKVLNSLSDS